jgi:hypothetical protein
MDAAKRLGLVRLMESIRALLDADDALSEPVPLPPEPLDLDVWRTGIRNRVLASDPASVKAALLGTLTDKPTVVAADLESVGLTKTQAELIITERDKARAAALALDG